ncbi:hypothetical protein [Streptomyces stackebrandtii]|uniref:hypothetical protein n=1 Tax=Streptomyces stackebrandtii TaxID=3051177 RepID=UPI0037DA0EE0
MHRGREALGLPVHDTRWQTETGAIMIANFAADPVRPGSMGRLLPGVETAVFEHGCLYSRPHKEGADDAPPQDRPADDP